MEQGVAIMLQEIRHCNGAFHYTDANEWRLIEDHCWNRLGDGSERVRLNELFFNRFRSQGCIRM